MPQEVSESGEIIVPEGVVPEFRKDLRPPVRAIGRCIITGEWASVIALDLGDIVIDTPDTTEGVEIDAEGNITFNKWKPVRFQNQATISTKGLELLAEFAKEQQDQIISITPELVYKWVVQYQDGSALSQFQFDPASNQEIEISSREIDFSRVAQISLIPRGNTYLPTYTFVKETGKFFQNGGELDVDYHFPYLKDSEIVNARKVQHDFGSITPFQSLQRKFERINTSVLYLFGWKVGGHMGPGPGCIIAIDERGNWRPFEYRE